MAKKIKTLLVSSLAIGSIAAPVAAVVSCGSTAGSSKTITKADVLKQVADETAIAESAKNTEINVQIRSEDYSIYTEIAKKFNALGKGKVKITTLTSGPADALQTESASGSIPTIFINDLNSNALIQQKGLYAKPIMLDDFLGEANKALYDVREGEASIASADINAAQKAILTRADGVQYGTPLGYGARALMTNTRLFRLAGFGVQADGTLAKDLKIDDYAPMDAPVSGATDTTAFGVKKLTGAGHEVVAHTWADVQSYINKAGDLASAADDANHWLGHGAGSMFQRIYSLGQSLKDQAPSNMLASVAIMPLKENLINFGLFASSTEGALDANKTLTIENFKSKLFPGGHASSTLSNYLWDSFGGYMYATGANTGYMTSDRITGDSTKGEVEPFANQQSIFNFNAKWAARSANDGWDNTGTAHKALTQDTSIASKGNAAKDGDMKIMSAPYSDISVADNMSIALTASTAETLIAKRFIRFIYQTDKASEITYREAGSTADITQTMGEAISKKFVSAIAPINKVQQAHSEPSDSDKVNSPSWYTTGLKDGHTSSDAVNGVAGQAWFQVGGNAYWTLFENQYRPVMQKYYGTTNSQDSKWTKDKFATLITDAYKLYAGEDSL